MAKRIGRDAERERRWRRIVRGQRGSGLSVRDYCRKSAVVESAFYFWRRELERRKTEQEQHEPAPKRGPRTAAKVAFLPVHVTEEVPPALAGGRIEIELAGGRRVHVAAPVDRQALADVLAVLEGKAC